MKIVNKQAARRLANFSFWWLFAAAALAAGLWLGQAGALGALRAAWDDLAADLTGPGDTSLPLLSLDISFDNYNQLLQQREQALSAGVLHEQDTTMVPATAQVDGQEVPVRVSLLPGVARHLGENEKWNLALETRDNQELLGQQQVNLLDPADNNWLAEWAFLESLRRDDLPASGYAFVNLVFNGDQRGVYAAQQALRSLLPAAEGQEPRVIVGYDPDPLWEAIAYFGGDVAAAVADPVTNYASNDLRFVAVADGRDPQVDDDSALAAQKERAQALLLGLQRGELAASEVFDVEAYGRFLALVDLWGAAGALSPFNLRYAYDPAADRLAPVGFNGSPLRGAERVPLAVTYGDPQIQEAYARAASEVSSAAYLETLRAALDPQLAALATATGQTGAAEAIWNGLVERQELLRRSLRPAQPVIAQLGPPERAQEAIIEVNVANAINLPLEFLGFDIDGATFLEVDPAWITAGKDQATIRDGRVFLSAAPAEQGNGLNFVTFALPVTQILAQDSELDFLNEMELHVATRLLGMETPQLTRAASGVRENMGVAPTPAP